MRVNTERHVDALHLRPVLRIGIDLFGRHDARAHDVAVVIDVVDEQIERLHPLAQAGFERLPFAARDDARDQIEGNQPLGAGQIAVDREGDAHAAKQQVGFRALARDGLVALLDQPALEARVMRPHDFVVMTHLVIASHVTPRSFCRIEGECAAHSVFDNDQASAMPLAFRMQNPMDAHEQRIRPATASAPSYCGGPQCATPVHWTHRNGVCPDPWGISDRSGTKRARQ